MRHTTFLIRNATSSVAQTVISGVVLFLLYRHLLNHLGAEQLGLWSVVLASTSVARLSDLGLSGSVVKFVARYRALADNIQAGAVIQTAAISIGIGIAVLGVVAYPLLGIALKVAVPAAAMPEALSILPWAVLSLWIASVAGVFQSGLDGCHRIDLRNLLIVVTNIIYLGAASWLVPRHGLLGLAIAQACQALILLLLSWMLIRREILSLPLIPRTWSPKAFREMFRYAASFQVTAIAVFFFEPMTKLLMSKFGGLSSAAYYEMASQVVTKLRALIISATQALVPAVANLHVNAPADISELYQRTYRAVFFLAVPMFSGIAITLPSLSILWIGRLEDEFVLFGLLLCLGWCLNTLTGPAYFFNLGTGELKWNSTSHVVMAALNVILGVAMGVAFGSHGILLSAMTALVVASCILLFGFNKDHQLTLRSCFPREHFGLVGVSTISAVGFYAGAVEAHLGYDPPRILLMGAHLLLIVVAMAANPLGRRVVVRGLSQFGYKKISRHP